MSARRVHLLSASSAFQAINCCVCLLYLSTFVTDVVISLQLSTSLLAFTYVFCLPTFFTLCVLL